jgi:hypothetical protein
MRAHLIVPIVSVLILPGLAAGQGSPSPSPVSDAFRNEAQRSAKNLVAAAEVMPADKYSFKPTPAQMSFGEIVLHLSGGNDALCGQIAGVKAPTRSSVTVASGKDALVARLKETFKFCDDALAKLTDANLGEKMTIFGMPLTRAGTMMVAADDWGDHYSQSAIYLRLNGLLPPTAKPAK